MRNLAVLIVVSVASVGLCADPSNENLAALNGRWSSESAVKAGEAYPDNVLKSSAWCLTRGNTRLPSAGTSMRGPTRLTIPRILKRSPLS